VQAHSAHLVFNRWGYVYHDNDRTWLFPPSYTYAGRPC